MQSLWKVALVPIADFFYFRDFHLAYENYITQNYIPVQKAHKCW